MTPDTFVHQSVERHSVPFFLARSAELLFVATPRFSPEEALACLSCSALLFRRLEGGGTYGFDAPDRRLRSELVHVATQRLLIFCSWGVLKRLDSLPSKKPSTSKWEVLFEINRGAP